MSTSGVSQSEKSKMARDEVGSSTGAGSGGAQGRPCTIEGVMEVAVWYRFCDSERSLVVAED